MAANSQFANIENAPLIHPECGNRSAQSQLSSSVVNEKSSTKSIKKDQKCFLFDIIVARLDIPNMTIEQSTKLMVSVNFNGKNLKISSNRINVVDFTTESLLEVVSSPLELKHQLSVAPLTLKVTDAKKKVLGYGTLTWPTKFLSDVEQSSGEVTGSFEIELMKCDGTRTGTMLITVRLQPKCEEYDEDNTLDGKCRNANREINPSDVLFVVGEESKRSCCCSQIGIIPASDSDHELQPKCLDLSSYRAVNSQNVNNINILAAQNPCGQNGEVATTNHFEKILEALKSKNNKQSASKEISFDQKRDLLYTLPSDSCFKVDVLPSSSNLCRKQEDFSLDGKAFLAKNVKQIAYVGSAPKLVENEPQSLRHCPLCKENMEYLPKLAACPNCCYKPVPNFAEKPYDDSQKADQILKEFHDDIQKNENSMADKCKINSSKSRCTCEYGSKKPCANCRIRKLCKDIFQPSPPDDICEQKSSVVNCVSSSDNRPFLTKLFTELKDIYDIEEPKKKEFKLDECCEKQLKKFSNNIKHLPKEKRNLQPTQSGEPNEIVKPKIVRKRKKCAIKAAYKKSVKSKLYDYQFTKQISTFGCGNKACAAIIPKYKNVPPNMGWLWNIHKPGKWKPGAIRKPIKELMRYFLKDFPADTLLVSRYSHRRKHRPSCEPSADTILQKPTLHVCKKNGEYVITMRPLKPIEVLKDCADPYENMEPIQFRIVKNPKLEKIRSLKNSLKSMGFKKCVCHRPLPYCYCRSFVEKKRLEYECRKECSKRQMESCCDTLTLTDTSESEDEFDFAVTPPVAVIKPEKLKKVDRVNVATQYSELDWNPMPLFPRPPNKYMQMYQCAVKERKANDTLAENDNAGAKDAYNTLRQGSLPKRTFGKSIQAANKRQIVGKNFTGTRGEGDGLFMGRKATTASVVPTGYKGDGLLIGKRPIKGSTVPTVFKSDVPLAGRGNIKGSTVPADFKAKYNGQGDPAFYKTAETIQSKKVNMLKYVQKSMHKMAKLTPEEVVLRRKEKLNLLKGTNPPLLCTIDRRGKPANPCVPCFPGADDRVC